MDNQNGNTIPILDGGYQPAMLAAQNPNTSSYVSQYIGATQQMREKSYYERAKTLLPMYQPNRGMYIGSEMESFGNINAFASKTGIGLAGAATDFTVGMAAMALSPTMIGGMAAYYGLNAFNPMSNAVRLMDYTSRSANIAGQFINPANATGLYGFGLSRQQSMKLGRKFRNMELNYGLDEGQAMGEFEQFGQANLFFQNQNGDQLFNQYTGIRKNVKAIKAMLNVAQEEAISILAEYKSMGILPQNALPLVSSTKMAARASGMSFSQMKEIGTLGISEFAGSGLNASSTYMNFMKNYQNVRSSFLNGKMSIDDMRNLGGEENAARSLAYTQFNYFKTGFGDVLLRAGAGGAGGDALSRAPGSINEAISGAIRNSGSVSGIAKYWVDQNKIISGAMANPDLANAHIVRTGFEQMSMAGFGNADAATKAMFLSKYLPGVGGDINKLKLLLTSAQEGMVKNQTGSIMNTQQFMDTSGTLGRQRMKETAFDVLTLGVNAGFRALDNSGEIAKISQAFDDIGEAIQRGVNKFSDKVATAVTGVRRIENLDVGGSYKNVKISENLRESLGGTSFASGKKLDISNDYGFNILDSNNLSGFIAAANDQKKVYIHRTRNADGSWSDKAVSEAYAKSMSKAGGPVASALFNKGHNIAIPNQQGGGYIGMIRNTASEDDFNSITATDRIGMVVTPRTSQSLYDIYSNRNMTIGDDATFISSNTASADNEKNIRVATALANRKKFYDRNPEHLDSVLSDRTIENKLLQTYQGTTLKAILNGSSGLSATSAALGIQKILGMDYNIMSVKKLLAQGSSDPKLIKTIDMMKALERQGSPVVSQLMSSIGIEGVVNNSEQAMAMIKDSFSGVKLQSVFSGAFGDPTTADDTYIKNYSQAKGDLEYVRSEEFSKDLYGSMGQLLNNYEKGINGSKTDTDVKAATLMRDIANRKKRYDSLMAAETDPAKRHLAENVYSKDIVDLYSNYEKDSGISSQKTRQAIKTLSNQDNVATAKALLQGLKVTNQIKGQSTASGKDSTGIDSADPAGFAEQAALLATRVKEIADILERLNDKV